MPQWTVERWSLAHHDDDSTPLPEDGMAVMEMLLADRHPDAVYVVNPVMRADWEAFFAACEADVRVESHPIVPPSRIFRTNAAGWKYFLTQQPLVG